VARVPTYDSAQVAPTEAGVAAPDINATQIAGQQAEKLGSAEEGSGSQMAYVGNLLQDQANQVRVQDAVNQATNAATALRYGSDDANGIHTPGYSEIAGENVMHVMAPGGTKAPLAQAYPAMLQQKLQDISSTLTPQQQQLFTAHAGALTAQFTNEVAAHQAQQFGVWKNTVNTDTLTSSANTVASVLPQMGTPQFDLVASPALVNAGSAIDKVLAGQGVMTLDPTTGKPIFADDASRNVYDTERKALMGKYVSTIVQAGVNNQQAPQAEAFLASQKDNLAPDDYARIHASVAQAAVGTTAMTQADAITTKLWPDQTQPPDLVKMYAAVRAANPTNSAQADATMDEIKKRWGYASFDKGQKADAAIDAASKDIANGKGPNDLMASPYWSDIPGPRQVELLNQSRNFSEALVNAGGGKGYDAVYGSGRYGTPSVPISQMTVGAVQGFQSGVLIPATRGKIGAGPTIGSGAVGAYGINYDTLKQYAPQVLGAKWQDEPFDQTNQFKIAQAIWNDRRGGDLHATWASLPHNAPGVYANVPFTEMAGTIAQGESGGTAPSKTDQAAAADAYLADPSTIPLATPQSGAVLASQLGTYAPHVIAVAKAYQNSTTKASLPTGEEVNAVMGGLGLTLPSPKNPGQYQIWANIRASLAQVMLANSKNGPITDPTERLMLMQKAAAQTVQTSAGNWWGSSAVPLIAATPDQLSHVVVPDDQVKDISDALKAKGMAVNPNTIRQRYLKRLTNSEAQ